jgi:hypothetical protein
MTGSGEGSKRFRREMPETMKKAPKIGALEWNLLFSPLWRARLGYFFFLAGAFFLVAAFLVAFFIDLFSLTSNFATRKNRNVIHI